MTYVPHFPATIHMAVPHTVFTEEAAEKQVGGTMTFCGVEVTVTKAWVEAGDMFMTIDNVIDQPWDEITAKHWTDIRDGSMTIKDAYDIEGRS